MKPRLGDMERQLEDIQRKLSRSALRNDITDLTPIMARLDDIERKMPNRHESLQPLRQRLDDLERSLDLTPLLIRLEELQANPNRVVRRLEEMQADLNELRALVGRLG